MCFNVFSREKLSPECSVPEPLESFERKKIMIKVACQHLEILKIFELTVEKYLCVEEFRTAIIQSYYRALLKIPKD